MKMFAIILALTAAAPLGLAGCDRTVSETSKTTESPNGTVRTDSKTVTQDANGGVTVTKEKSVSNP